MICMRGYANNFPKNSSCNWAHKSRSKIIAPDRTHTSYHRSRSGRSTFLYRLDRKPHRQTARTPIAALFFESPCDFVPASSTTIILKIPFAELVPIALDQQFAATGTPCAAAFAIVDVSSVNVMKSFRACDL